MLAQSIIEEHSLEHATLHVLDSPMVFKNVRIFVMNMITITIIFIMIFTIINIILNVIITIHIYITILIIMIINT